MTLCLQSANSSSERRWLSTTDSKRVPPAVADDNGRTTTITSPSTTSRCTDANTEAILQTLNSASWAIVTTLSALQKEFNMSTDLPTSRPRAPPGEGAAYPWILEHILTYPGTYEIPLRTMYTLNSSPRAQPLPQQFSRPTSPSTSNPSSPPTSPLSPRFPQDVYTQNANDHFKSNLMAQISQLPTQPCSLPPSFITSFVRRCFPEELTMVDFPQALTGLDYLRDLETRRRREIAGACRRLGIDGAASENATKYRQVGEWQRSIEEKERRCEALYASVYIGIRRWTLINEMSLLPFNKANCLAMLNTLYPPTSTTQPTPQLTPPLLQKQRDGFFRYIQAVEKNGPDVLGNLNKQGYRPERGETTGWPSTREFLDNYLRVTNGIIDECAAITGLDYFVPTLATKPSDDDAPRKGRKVDSGVSFASTDRPSTSCSTTHPRHTSSTSSFGTSATSSVPPSPTFPTHPKGVSTLEKIARELRRMRDKKKLDEARKAAAAAATATATAEKPPPRSKSRPPPAMLTQQQSPTTTSTVAGSRLRKQASASAVDDKFLRDRQGFVTPDGSGVGAFRSKTPTYGWDGGSPGVGYAQ